MLQFLKKANATCAGATLAQIGHRLNYGREWHTISSQKPQTAMGTSFTTWSQHFWLGSLCCRKAKQKAKETTKTTAGNERARIQRSAGSRDHNTDEGECKGWARTNAFESEGCK
jgi:hypothetical protein